MCATLEPTEVGEFEYNINLNKKKTMMTTSNIHKECGLN